MNAAERGAAGEEAVSRYLTSRGFRVLARNYHSRYGEIDMIAADAQYILFVEVKTRSPGSLGTPGEAVDRRKQDKITKTALQYLAAHKTDLQPRFDVAEVYITDSGAQIRYIPNAFSAHSYY